MAKSSKKDPTEKFRFNVYFLSLGLSAVNIARTLASLSNIKQLKDLTRAGFNEVDIPKANITEINYRENLDGFRFSKSAGLVKFDPVALRRGVTSNRDLYNWYREVNNDKLLSSVATQFSGGAAPYNPQDEDYRKDVVIESVGRGGKIVKRWILFNAFPISYKAGNDLDANSSDKLIEEIVLTYEHFVEMVVKAKSGTGVFDGDQLSAIAGELAKDAAELAVDATVDTLVDTFGSGSSGFKEDF